MAMVGVEIIFSSAIASTSLRQLNPALLGLFYMVHKFGIRGLYVSEVVVYEEKRRRGYKDMTRTSKCLSLMCGLILLFLSLRLRSA